ncbi:MAG TPA: hypothetical protein DEB06_02835 [Phycisphaerales bacterium]|nr:hypothetical protein [Phycisphaerales bacterium]
MSTAAEHEVVVERMIKASPQRIFRALTDAGELEKWFFSECRTDPRAGGDYRFKWRSPDEPDRDHDRFGSYLEFIPDERLVFEWLGEPTGRFALPKGMRSIVTITLAKRAEGTLLRLVHTGWPDTQQSAALRDSHASGWTFYMGNLDRFLNGAEDLRAAHHAQQIGSR